MSETWVDHDIEYRREVAVFAYKSVKFWTRGRKAERVAVRELQRVLTDDEAFIRWNATRARINHQH